MSETVWYTFSTEGEPLHPTMPEDHEPWYKGEVVIKGAVPPPTGNEQRWIVTVYGKSGNATKWDGVPVPFTVATLMLKSFVTCSGDWASDGAACVMTLMVSSENSNKWLAGQGR